VLDEADESELWLDVASARSMGRPHERSVLLNESRELRAILR
jgi:hypothetical protein